ncbi:hypothetical protein B0H14DRAFT_2616657 [Mycena olivaceomarginata]|nr:hypothetical protein B0H14DRAFT_2616657 [Mycena olivaceomarginata]
MNFQNYIKTLVLGRGVGLLVWPDGVDFKTKWVKLSRKQQDKIVEEFKEMVQEGKLEEKIRNTRSDKGGTHQIRNPRRRIYRRAKTKRSSPAHSKKPSAPVKKAPAAKKPTAPKKSSSASGAKPSRKRGAVDHAEEPPKKKRQGNTDKGGLAAEKTKVARGGGGGGGGGGERPRKKKKPAELKRLEKQMSKGKEKSQEERERPKPRPIIKGKKGGPPGVRETES